MKGMWLRGGRIVDPTTGRDEVGDLYVEGAVVVAAPTGEVEEIDCAGRWVMPGFVDLYADLPDVMVDLRAAGAGGYTTVVQTAKPALDRPMAVWDLRDRLLGSRPKLLVTPAATIGLEGQALTDIGTLAGIHDVVGVSCGRTVVADTRVLRGIFQYAAQFDLLVILRGADAALEEGGIVRDGGRAAWLGLPGIPPASEAIGIARIAAIARLTGARVHVSHLWTAEGVDALRAAKLGGTRITASCTAHHLALDDHRLVESGYAGLHRAVPPLGDAADRAALADALLDGTLAGVATDHRPLPSIAQEVELSRSEAGATGFLTALPLALGALSQPLAVARALATGPAGVLGRGTGLAPGAPADVVVVDPDREWTVGDGLGSHGNTPLRGEVVRGRATLTLRAGRLVASTDGAR